MEPRWRSNYIEVYTEKWNEDYDLIAFLINTYISKLHKTLHKKRDKRKPVFSHKS